jgi:methylase of polypeptide subunit release factors
VLELADDDLRRLRERLEEVDYTVDGVRGVLGPVAHQALHRNETAPGLRATRGNGPLSTLVRLWLLQASVPYEAAERALPELVEPLRQAGILHKHGGQVSALLDVRPYGTEYDDWWVVADLTPGMDGERPAVTPDHVLGVNSSATTLAQLTVRTKVERALDLGTGCGIQALHLADHAATVVATDVNARALAVARLNARLADLDVDLRAGSLFEPVDGERFDLVVSNPPFVISPGGDLVYRDSGLAGDQLCRQLVRQLPRHLTKQGVGQVLANWLHVRGESWTDRLTGWVARTGCDAWVVQREVTDPAAYVELWLRDAGVHGTPEYARRYDEWLGWFEDQNVEAIGFGWLTLRRTDAQPVLKIEEWPHPIEQPLGRTIQRWLENVDLLRGWDDQRLLGERLEVKKEVDQEQVGRPGGNDPEYLILRQRGGMCRALRVDTAMAGFVGACDGTMTVGQIIDALAQLLFEDIDPLRHRLLGKARELILDGFLDPVSSAR